MAKKTRCSIWLARVANSTQRVIIVSADQCHNFDNCYVVVPISKKVAKKFINDELIRLRGNSVLVNRLTTLPAVAFIKCLGTASEQEMMLVTNALRRQLDL